MNTLHPSVVYRTLREMEGLEWIQSDWETDQTQGPPRRTYRLTVQGEEALRNWQHELGKTQELISDLLKRIEK
jgi:DNA-binding PadR family transcriptional regulator